MKSYFLINQCFNISATAMIKSFKHLIYIYMILLLMSPVMFFFGSQLMNTIRLLKSSIFKKSILYGERWF